MKNIVIVSMVIALLATPLHVGHAQTFSLVDTNGKRTPLPTKQVRLCPTTSPVVPNHIQVWIQPAQPVQVIQPTVVTQYVAQVQPVVVPQTTYILQPTYIPEPVVTVSQLTYHGVAREAYWTGYGMFAGASVSVSPRYQGYYPERVLQYNSVCQERANIARTRYNYGLRQHR